MKSIIRPLLLIIAVIVFDPSLSAQQKTQSYYNIHESEILPDAQNAFEQGEYERAKELCLWHYIIVGSHAADNLRDQAERCASLSKQMESLRTTGKLSEAREIAKAILSINPADKSAKEVFQTLDPLIVEKVPSIDSIAIKAISEPLLLRSKEKETIEKNPDSEMAPVYSNQMPKVENKAIPNLNQSETPLFHFVVKAGVTILEPDDYWANSICYGGSLGLYDLVGTRCGVEVGLSFGKKTLDTGLIGHKYNFYNIAFVFRLAKSIYPKAEIGIREYYNKPYYNDYYTPRIDGLCYGLGVTFLLGGHACVEASAKYAVNGIVPSIAFGWAF